MDENKDLNEQTLNEEPASQKRFKKRFVIIPVAFLLCIVGTWWIIGDMLGYTTYSRMQTKCSSAHSFAKVCMQWEEDGHTLQPGIWQIQHGNSTFEDYVLHYYSASEGQWFGLVLDKDGKIEYTLNSEVEVPQEYLSHPPVYEEQMALLDSHFAFRRRKAVAVWYTDDTKNTMND